MRIRYISQLMMGLSMVVLHQSAQATQGAAPKALSVECLSQLEKVTPPLPTVNQMLDVDPVKVPWGINLNLVEEFGSRFRSSTGLGDECNIAPKITNYQKNQSDLKKTQIVIPIIQDMMDGINLIVDTKLKGVEASKNNKKGKDKAKQEIEHDKAVALKPLQEKMDQLNRQKRSSEVGITENSKFMLFMGLTKEQIAKLPDLDTWRAMKKEAQETTVPPRPQMQAPSEPKAQVNPSPTRRPIQLAPQRMR